MTAGTPIATLRSRLDGSEASLLAPGWNAEGWGTLENENGDRWRDERSDWEETS